MQLANSKHLRGRYNESDAIAALHLVWFSQLPTDDNPRVKLNSFTATGQLIVKLTLVSTSSITRSIND